MTDKFYSMSIISIVCLIGLVCLEVGTWYAFTFYYPAIGWTMYGSNPDLFYKVIAEIFAAIFIVGNGLVVFSPESDMGVSP